jgi:hypothetical protein
MFYEITYKIKLGDYFFHGLNSPWKRGDYLAGLKVTKVWSWGGDFGY